MPVNNDSSVPNTDYVKIIDMDETNVASTSDTDSNLREQKTLISPKLVTSMNLNDPEMWPIMLNLAQSWLNKIWT